MKPTTTVNGVLLTISGDANPMFILKGMHGKKFTKVLLPAVTQSFISPSDITEVENAYYILTRCEVLL
ncbi:MAG: hypothetical protein ACLVIY_08480 [Anaerobutyricum soehngenii]